MRTKIIPILISVMLFASSVFIISTYNLNSAEKETTALQTEESTSKKEEENTTSEEEKKSELSTTKKENNKPSSTKKDEEKTSEKNKTEKITSAEKEKEKTTSQTKDEEKTTSAKKDTTPKPQTKILVFENIKYGKHNNHTFDLNLPVDSRKEIGLILYLHGGGWISGDKAASKDSYSVNNNNKNFATASINYRFINDGETDVEDIIDDITLALTKIKSLAADYSMNLTKVILSGHSAGGHLSLLYAYKYKDISPIEPVGVFASAPVPDLSLDSFYTNNVLGDEEYMCSFISQLCGTKFTPKSRASKKEILDKYSPINYISASTVPTLIIHGDGDRIAPFKGSVALMKKLSRYSVNHELIIFENTGHSLKDNPEKEIYASKLMVACAEEWFGIRETTETQIN